MNLLLRRIVGVLTAGALLAGCGGGGAAPGGASPGGAAPLLKRAFPPPSPAAQPKYHSPIKHIVLMIQENRSFNDFFATFPGADGTTTGQAEANYSCSPPIQAGSIALTEMPLLLTHDMNHTWKTGYSVAYDGGNMDGFDLIKFGGNGPPECTAPYQYTDPSDIAPYIALATQYTLAEHMFTTTGSDSFVAHQDLIRGGTIVDDGAAMVDDPTCSRCFWGCDAVPGTRTHLITQYNVYEQKGPFPCTRAFQEPYHTLRDLLDAKHISWKYYVPPSSNIYGKLWSAYDVIYNVRHSGQWTHNVITPETKILTAIQDGELADMSWVIPEGANSDHPDVIMNSHYVDNGPEWVATVVNAIGESKYWDSTAIIIVWDDWGGFYDNEGGALGAYGGPGERVPAIIVSPYARAGYISPTIYQFGSILNYIEHNWLLGSLHTTDETSTSIRDCFNYKQTPIQFQPITTSLGPQYFLHEKHSYLAPDDDW